MSVPGKVAVVAAATFFFLLLFLFDPATSGLFPPCPFRRATGLLCPGCGSLRGLHRLLHGDLAGAWAKNPLMPVSLPALLGLWLFPRWAAKVWVPWAALGILLAWWAARNLLGDPG